MTISIARVTLERSGYSTRRQIVGAAARAPLGSSANRDGRDRIVALVEKAGESLDTPAAAV